MKVELLKDKFTEAVGKAEKITGKNLTLPILSTILLAVGKNSLTITATNLDLGIKIILPVKSQDEGVWAVPGSVLTGVLAALHDVKNLTLSKDEGGNLVIATPKNAIVVKSMPHEDFPSLPATDKDKVYTVPVKEFVRCVKSVLYSAAVGSMKPELASVYMYTADDMLVCAATDSFRLAEKKVRLKKALGDIGHILIPLKNSIELVRLLENVPGDVEMVVNKNQISFSFEGTYIVSRVIDGTFPDYHQIVPKDYMMEAVLLKQDVVQALKVATIFSDKFNKVSIKATHNSFEISTKNADVGENATTIPAVLKGGAIESSFNYRYIMDCFQSIESDSVGFYFSGPNRALVIRGVSDPSFMYLVMPMNK